MLPQTMKSDTDFSKKIRKHSVPQKPARRQKGRKYWENKAPAIDKFLPQFWILFVICGTYREKPHLQ